MAIILVCFSLGSASAKIVPREETVTQQLVSPRLVHKHYDPHDLVSLAAQVDL